MSEMRGLTLWQPWASLLASGAKMYETRGRPLSYSGPIAIHAGLKFLNSFMQGFASAAHKALKALVPGFTYMHELPRGYAVGIGNLVGCYPIIGRTVVNGQVVAAQIRKDGKTVEITGDELLFGDWTPGRFALELANVRILAEPVPMKGAQGLWRVKPEDEIILKAAV